MADNKKSPLFGIGLAVGAVLAGLAAFFYNPISGEKHREQVEEKIKEFEEMLREKEIDKRVKEIYGEITAEVKARYLQTKKMLVKRLAVLKVKIKKIDKEKYLELVNEIVEEVKVEFQHTEEIAKKLKDQLVEDWKKII